MLTFVYSRQRKRKKEKKKKKKRKRKKRKRGREREREREREKWKKGGEHMNAPTSNLAISGSCPIVIDCFISCCFTFEYL